MWGGKPMKPSFLTAAVVLIALCSHGCTSGSGTKLTAQEAKAAQASSAFFLSVMSSTIASTSGDAILFNKEMLNFPQTKEPSRRK
jgi:hypothetical protein